ncbi:MAG: ribosome biogenesis GTP-binding protein YihA/YsxC [Bulleidia sp.]
MKSYQAKLIATAARENQWPDSTLPEIVFAGRSNAGKSSLINALVNRKNLAYSGKTPGKTRLLNFFEIDGKVVFTDCPGYGYATSDTQSAIAFGKLIDPYFQKRDNLKGMVLVLDCRRVPSDEDIEMIEYGRDAHLNIIIACTKADKISRGKYLSNAQKIASVLNLPVSALVPVDSISKKGVDDVWEKINQML